MAAEFMQQIDRDGRAVVGDQLAKPAIQLLINADLDPEDIEPTASIFGRAGLAIPRSTLAAWVGSCGVQLQPLVDALKQELLRHTVLHADETPVAMLKPGNGKTHRA